MLAKSLAGIVAACSLCGCGSFMEEQDASNPTIVAQATSIPFYTQQNGDGAPHVKTILGPAIGNSCNNVNSGFTSSETAALQQMRLKALAMGATGVVGVHYEHSPTNFAKNCWASVAAIGTAVIFEKAN